MNLRMMGSILLQGFSRVLPAFFAWVVCHTYVSAAERDAYGVWARGRDFDLREFPYKGVDVEPSWEQIEPKEGVFNWEFIDTRLAEAASLGLYVSVSVNVGFECPAWIYAAGVPSVTTNHRVRKGPFPYCLDERYVRYYHRLIEAFGRHLRSLPESITSRIAYVHVKTGSTHDEVPYKGDLTPPAPSYEVSDEQWDGFRLAAFEKFKRAFQDGEGPVFPLLFNRVLDNPKLLQWVSNNIKGGWGHKQAGYGQCYQLNFETERGLMYLDHLIDPAPGVYAFFTRCEMDQAWQWGVFGPNKRMGFYWTSLSALHSGLGVWNLSQSAREWCHANNYWEHAVMFSRYASQTRSPEATGAFSALRQGLDSADTAKFPEAVYGRAFPENADRYQAICAAYAARGARMDDPRGVARGQMFQRLNQKGLNDSGWMIYRGNYERFLHQLDADETSVGWWRVNGVGADAPVYGRFARGFEHASGKNRMAFDIRDSFFSGQPLDGAYPVTVRVVYFDQGTGTWELRYDAREEADKIAFSITNADSGTWKEKSMVLSDAHFGNRGPRGADLSLVNTDAEDEVFHLVELTR